MKKESGQSLVEMIVAIGVLVVVIVSLVSITTVSLQNASFSRDQSLATKYAQDGIAKIRSYRDQNTWPVFTADCETVLSSVALPSPFSFNPAPDCYVPGTTDNCSSAEEKCEVKVVVSWADSKGTHNSEITTRLANWK